MDSPTKTKISDLFADGDVEGARQAVADYLAEFDYKKGYRASIDYLDENFAFFLTHVLNMGKPELDTGIPTAAVMLPSKKAKRDEFKYVFNPTLFALLTDEERAFVMGHETMHILLNHLMLLRKGTESGKFSDMRKFNIAADCVINDYLVSLGLLPGRLGNFGAFGPNVVGYDCSNATVSEVYLDIPESEEGGEGEDGEDGEGESQPGQGGGAGQGDPLEDFMNQAAGAQAAGEGFDDHGWMQENDPDAEAEAEKIADDGKKEGNGKGMPSDLEDKKDDDAGNSKSIVHGAGSGVSERMERWREEQGVSMAWAELLMEVDPDMFKVGGPPPRPSYHFPRRKLAGINAGRKVAGERPIILPVMRKDDSRNDGEIPSIFMALDASGSCSHHINTFVTLAKSIPANKIKLWPVTFTTAVKELDLEDPKWVSGGTSFGPIEQYIRTVVVPELGHYPKAVVMVTDGDGAFGGNKPTPENQEKWLWLCTDSGQWANADAKSVGRWLKYDDFAKGVKGTVI